MSAPGITGTGTTGTGTLLGVWAHPDDEAYLSAGLMALARSRGERVVVVTATAGEHGTADPEQWPPARLARRRRRELSTSLAAVGVHEHRWLGYVDGTCNDVPAAAATAAIARVIDEVRPDTIVTFGPDGMTGHPDHVAVSSWTTAAWSAARPSARLWYATLLPSFHDTWGQLNAEVGLFPDGTTPPMTDETEAAAVVHCDGWLAERKQAALRAHASQVQPLVDLVGDDTFRRWWVVEAFADATRVPARSALMSAPVGTRARRSRTVRTADIGLFTELTGDRNPLHYDEAAAEATRFGGIVVQGGVTTGLLNAVVAQDLPGPGSVFLHTDWSYRAPVRPGDTITAEVEVLEVRDDKPISRLRTTITNQHGTVVVDGSALVWTEALPDPPGAPTDVAHQPAGGA